MHHFVCVNDQFHPPDMCEDMYYSVPLLPHAYTQGHFLSGCDTTSVVLYVEHRTLKSGIASGSGGFTTQFIKVQGGALLRCR